MIRNFEDQTDPLSPEESILVPKFIQGLKTKIGKEKAISNKQIQNAFLTKSNIKIPAARVRKIINYIRINGKLDNLCATSKGYYVASNKEEMDDYLLSLIERISAQTEVYDSLLFQKNNTHWNEDK